MSLKRWSWICATLLVCSLATSVRAAVGAQDISEQATLETRQPQVQWSPAGQTEWQEVPTRETVRVGDRVRTGPGWRPSTD